jgi:hypothetical protein
MPLTGWDGLNAYQNIYLSCSKGQYPIFNVEELSYV